jgi:hypothetical protein
LPREPSSSTAAIRDGTPADRRVASVLAGLYHRATILRAITLRATTLRAITLRANLGLLLAGGQIEIRIERVDATLEKHGVQLGHTQLQEVRGRGRREV